ncbi:hypothetical protein [Pandoraea apista]|uniref:Uncharacterized protein n=1 Tax=Pandoraea apista TaxID=93218 RepID=A0A5E5NZX9_9BURK|nr:hypothetical protein [Pandoraea apista]AJE98538.1 hypothetical protein SG18_10740 [Pandoraea apista]AKH72600.1 hypothetical protein XM39_10940 [Pandoraea apista]AKI60986.1 hypothetical protein AA956_03195 [Pandoraea apista]OXS95503.1 hypothetical protein B7H01_07130 [Pandoraea apista]VVG69670.1 hypothetical protein PAP18089_00627 [Pandoraea apista]
MNRWRKLLVLWLLCVTMPLQAMAALRTHCAPETPGQIVIATTAATDASATHHTTMIGGQDDAAPGMHRHDGASTRDATPLPVAHQDTSMNPAASDTSHSHHASCSACAACVVCTALPPSVVIRMPDAQPSTAIPFLRTSVASAVVGVPERPPKALAV